ncbi:MAG: DUF2269 family protein [Solirubrobacterales bacterium]
MPLAITMYTLSVAIHVVFVVSFLGAAGAFSVIGPMMKDNPQHAVFGLQVIKKVYEVSVFPGILVVFGTGMYQLSDAGYNLGDDLWLTVSLVLFAFMVVAAFFLLYPATKTALSELESQETPGPPSEKALKSIQTMRIFGPAMGISMMVITFLMVAKPF